MAGGDAGDITFTGEGEDGEEGGASELPPGFEAFRSTVFKGF